MKLDRIISGRTRTRIVAAGTALIILSSGAIAALNAQPANAIGITHKGAKSTLQNNSGAIEKPSISFSCNDTTGAYSLSLVNVQVIQADHISRWPSLTINLFVNTQDYSEQTKVADIPVQQNSSTGLFFVKTTGFLPVTIVHQSPGATMCRTGNQFFVNNSAADLLLLENLS